MRRREQGNEERDKTGEEMKVKTNFSEIANYLIGSKWKLQKNIY
jgi:hypothetical protein